MDMLFYWITEVAFFVSGIIYVHTRAHREHFVKKILVFVAGFAIASVVANLAPIEEIPMLHRSMRLIGMAFIIIMQYSCFEITKSVAIYSSIWAFMSWQLIYELLAVIISMDIVTFTEERWLFAVVSILLYTICYAIIVFTIAKWMPQGGPKRIGPRQLTSAILIFGAFEIIAFTPGNILTGKSNWQVLYLTQLLMAVILYLQSELFKKSAMRRELEVINLLWKKEQEQYKLSRENIALINQKCHDLKHQIRAIRNASEEDKNKYLEGMEDSIRIYEAIVKTGNEVLDTILTEKSLYCKDKEITVSCVADGSQMNFIDTADLYAILGNALDNAIEAVVKLESEEQKQIDVMVYRQQNFLVMNIVNPIAEKLVYEEDLPVTTKGDKRYHGFGLKSMNYIVKKYDGFLNISEADGCFSLKILIPIKDAT